MPWLPLYLIDHDIQILNDWLNKDAESYFIRQVDRMHWKLVKEMQISKSGYFNRYRLWHLPSGPVPIIKDPDPLEGVPIFENEVYQYVDNPFEPWPGRLCANLPGLPFFNDKEVNTFTVTIHNPEELSQPIPISGIEWQGNHYKVIGKPATAVAEKWWKRLRAFAKKAGTQIPRMNNPNFPKEVFAFPNAMAAIKNGRECTLN